MANIFHIYGMRKLQTSHANLYLRYLKGETQDVLQMHLGRPETRLSAAVTTVVLIEA